METVSIMQKALGVQWYQLPKGLQQHYAADTGGHYESGVLSIRYPGRMQWPLNALRLLGALLNRRGEQVPTEVRRWSRNARQHWERTVTYPDGHRVKFRSVVVYAGNNELIEYTNAVLGLRMQVSVADQQLFYHSRGYVLNLGVVQLPIPEWLALGHATIVETELYERRFAMDFRLRHPLFGEVFSYAGEFTVLNAEGQEA